MRIAVAVGLTSCLVLTAFSAGRAYDRDETSLTVQVSSADHELEEGYFSLGDKATVMARPVPTSSASSRGTADNE